MTSGLKKKCVGFKGDMIATDTRKYSLPACLFLFFHIQMNAIIHMRKQVSQVSKTRSSSGTYVCSMQGGACGIWTLGGMFPLGYRVSSCKGYKKGSTWLIMKIVEVGVL
jgi:hypothetical protein